MAGERHRRTAACRECVQLLDGYCAGRGPSCRWRVLGNEAIARDDAHHVRDRHGQGADVILAVVQEKGGVGKTTTAINVGAWYGQLGHKTLLIDLDPQGSLAKGIGVSPARGTMYRVFRDSAFPFESAIVPTGMENVDIAGADGSLEAAEVELVHALSRESVLRRKFEAEGIASRYDRIVIDCRPSLGVLTINAMVAADRLLIPVETHYFAVEALQTLLDVVANVRQTLNSKLEIAGIVPTKHEPRARVCQATLAILQERYPGLLTQAVIPKYVAFPEAQMRGVPILDAAAGSRASEAYRALVLELDGVAPDSQVSEPGSGSAPAHVRKRNASAGPYGTGDDRPKPSRARRGETRAPLAAQGILPLDQG